MSMTIASATARIARNLNASEYLIARSVGAVGEVATTLSLAQVEVPGAPRGEAQQAILRVLSAQRKLAAAQSDMLRAHSELKSIAVTMTGEEPWCPDSLVSAERDCGSIAA